MNPVELTLTIATFVLAAVGASAPFILRWLDERRRLSRRLKVRPRQIDGTQSHDLIVQFSPDADHINLEATLHAKGGAQILPAMLVRLGFAPYKVEISSVVAAKEVVSRLAHHAPDPEDVLSCAFVVTSDRPGPLRVRLSIRDTASAKRLISRAIQLRA